MYRYLTGRGIDGARLLLEDRSTTTAENLQYSMELLQQHGIDGPVTIITSEFHEYRANQTAKRLWHYKLQHTEPDIFFSTFRPFMCGNYMVYCIIKYRNKG